jgi:hypothetical protein
MKIPRNIKSIQRAIICKELKKIKGKIPKKRGSSGLPRNKFGRITIINEKGE